MPALCRDLFARAPDFFKNFVFHRFNYIINSCGVQMTGGLKPSRSQMSRNFSTIAALAMCRQFQVSRKSIPYTAAVATWAASVSALAGINRLASNARDGKGLKIGMKEQVLTTREAHAPRLAHDGLGGRGKPPLPGPLLHKCAEEREKTRAGSLHGPAVLTHGQRREA